MNKIKALREQRRLSQQELAKAAGVAQASIHYIETGQKSPTVRTLDKLAAALGVPVSELLDDKI
ncbi:MAG: helix-turn-helix transcriptional regulator [Firmicutes bacterium]|nr:helix-turn-helix transcriptional regulator [Bacillota bacterium]